MQPKDVLAKAGKALHAMKGRTLDVLEISAPPDAEYAAHLAKVVSKLSPIIGNTLEYLAVKELNQQRWGGLGKWRRQDPGFPDTIFDGSVRPMPGIEIKTWFPLATEITARFKESSERFANDEVDVAVIAWLPEKILYGKPKILDVWIGSAKSLAEARDTHYHQPPDYLVIEPEDTTARTSNLQQTNTNGYKFQDSEKMFSAAETIVDGWGKSGRTYSTSDKYQEKLHALRGKFKYRLDTNFAKIDRIEHTDLEDFKRRVLASSIQNKTVLEWSGVLSEQEEDVLKLVRELI